MGHHKGNKVTPSQSAYNMTERWRTNKIKKLKRHVKRHPKDKTALAAIKRQGG